MKPYSSLKSVLAEFLHLNRTLASDDMDKTYGIIGSYMPESANFTTENYVPFSQAWTWKVPERYVVHGAYLETEDGERIVEGSSDAPSRAAEGYEPLGPQALP